MFKRQTWAFDRSNSWQEREHFISDICENVHAGVGAATFVIAAVELPFPVENRFKVLALYTCYQAVASAR